MFQDPVEPPKRTSGIPKSFLERENNPEPSAQQTIPEEKQQIPEDLICSICKDLFTDAVMIPCCGSSFCDECVRTALLESEDNECPDCREKGSSPGSLIPNRFLRTSVNAFRNETGYTKRKVEAPKIQKPEDTQPEEVTEVIQDDPEPVDTEVVREKTPEKEKLEDIHEDLSDGSPAHDSREMDNESDYEDNISVTVPPVHVQNRGAFRGHYNGRQHSSRHSRHHGVDTPPSSTPQHHVIFVVIN